MAWYNTSTATTGAGQRLSSTSLATDSNGQEVTGSRTLYYPYGEERWSASGGTLPTDFEFTGQRKDSYTQLVQMGARWYDPYLGRWISPDTIVPDPANPQSFNRYSYVVGNPLRYRDPTGHYYCGDIYDPACLETQEETNAYAKNEAQMIMQQLGGVDDVEAMAQISDLYAELYPDWGTFMRKMSWVFLGVEAYGPTVLISAVLDNMVPSPIFRKMEASQGQERVQKASRERELQIGD
ncbi:MAG: RHS repeat-associated core domain-containing protein [Proteobacteria bacterium]|nr:RHS repeat-associated core domain-containing protein [Pseudomonadota bacterium]